MQHPMRYTTSVVTCLSKPHPHEFVLIYIIPGLDYGVRCEAYEDPAVHGIEEIMLRVCELLMPGSKPPVEDFPWLKWVDEHA